LVTLRTIAAVVLVKAVINPRRFRALRSVPVLKLILTRRRWWRKTAVFASHTRIVIIVSVRFM